ncbi:MAG: A/G-specific adenine glycosylase, partial [Calditerricola sp.]|nr:A/G-specific adenine glycosylase [Calditerricola sp.]
MLQGFDVAGVRRRLVEWFHCQKRDLPWRRDRDPYKIWVSEVMLQQTRVETVLPYYLRFVERFPTVEALAAAEEADVLKLWEGLGYYSRARNLLRGARQVMEEFGGVLPDDPEQLARIKGIGPYTAGAILSIAYGRPVPAVDGNVLRVLSRLLLVEEDIQKPGNRRLFTELAAQLVCPDDPSSFNQ